MHYNQFSLFVGGEKFTDIGFDQLVSEQDLITDVDTEALLLYFHWEHDRRVYKWQKHLDVHVDQ